MDTHYISAITQTEAVFRNKLTAYYGNLSELERIDIFSRQAALINHNSHMRQPDKKSEFYYGMWIRSINEIFQQNRALSGKTNPLPGELAELHRQRIRTVRCRKKMKSGRLGDAVRIRFDEIRSLRQEGLSWRDISVYLSEFGSLTINYAYLSTVYRKACAAQGVEML